MVLANAKFYVGLIFNQHMKRSPFCLLFFLVCSQYVSANEKTDTTIRGVAIHFDYTPQIFPKSWLTAEINAHGVEISPRETDRCVAAMTKAVKKYPEQVLVASLKAVYFLKSMEMFDVGFGGTNSRTAVYITDDGEQYGYTDSYIEQTFHHEFSSILFRNFPGKLDTAAWKAAIIAGFDYNDPYEGVGAIRKNESSQQLDSALSAKGFLTQYALSGIENDINTIAQNLFRPDGKFWGFVKYYPRIQKKVSLLISFYHKIDPVFTEAYFKSFARE